ncbi:T9SS type A sorting domain-containing protein [Flavobacterium sufflavum]|uniref:T9SS type A sorting domain-containing protein n=1 Tax=Flavobacterium sufflavum TaxID=1921138 RepID=A0A3S3SQD9_9FLAO|nr:S8 family serine peptidase [Flavobacterium sufflavum]RVT71349.1 T9SS type A sorting domain-containing protein [Flavobacterium sufflavum]
MKKFVLLFLIFVPLLVFSQEEAWVYFNAKANEQYFLDNPSMMLSQRALDRRSTQNIALDFKDVPINQSFINTVSAVSGIKVMAKSKWLNAIHVRGTQSLINSLKNFGFVAKVDFADKTLNTTNKIVTTKSVEIQKSDLKKEKTVYAYGGSAVQVEMLNGQLLHQQNYTGSGKIIAVLDSGFPGVDKALPFKRLRDNNQILGGYNFVKRNDDIFSQDSHGTFVLSTMGAYVDNVLIGTAPGASYYLFITEDVTSENPVEESLWVEAAEKADSLGVDIISSSLGYTDFDNPAYNHNYSDRNGTSTFISKGAEIAFSRGMLVVVSSGNDGGTKSPYIGAPADAPSVIAVGAVKADKTIAGFSSIGPSFDGRIKPDVMAQGEKTVVSDENGNSIFLSGTSFSAPIISGMLACLWQAYPDKTNQEIKELMLESATKYAAPDNQYGYGIPDFGLALNKGVSLKSEKIEYYVAYPNPASDVIAVDFPPSFNSGKVLFYNVLGQKVLEKKVESIHTDFSLESLNRGIYFYHIESDSVSKNGKIIKK